MNKKNIIILVIVVLVTNVFTYSFFSNTDTVLTDKTAKEVVATLKGKEITSDEIYGTWKDGGSTATPYEVMLTAVDKSILDDKFANDEKIDNDVEKQLTQLKNYYESNGQDLEKLLEDSGLTMDKWVNEIIKPDIQKGYAATEYVESIVTDEEIQEAFKADVPKYKTSHILVKPDTAETDADKADAAALKLAKEIIVGMDGEIAAGGAVEETFAKYAKEFSGDESSKNNGGDIGYSNSESEAYTKAANKLEVGKYTAEPVKTDYGYEIILKTDQREAKDITNEDVIAEYRSEVAKVKLEEQPALADKAMEELRKEYNLDIIDTTLKAQYVQQTETLETTLNPKEEE